MITLALILLLCLFSFTFLLRKPSPSTSKSIAIIVLGDIGRSPRILYHAYSFVEHGYQVTIIAQPGSNPPKALLDSPSVKFIYLSNSLEWISNLSRPFYLLLVPFKILFGSFGLFWSLLVKMERPRFILVQNPPSIPTLPIVQFVSWIRGCLIIIDWHNTGHSVLALRLGVNSPLVKLAKWIEETFGRNSFAHLTVTRAMLIHLKTKAGIKDPIHVFYDRPPTQFHRQTENEAHNLLNRLPFLQDSTLTSFLPPCSSTTSSFTQQLDSEPAQYRLERPALLISATSWTEDEDFSILLAAFNLYEKAATAYANGSGGTKTEIKIRKKSQLPKIMMVITGKGAGKIAFEAKVKELEKNWQWVRIRTAWLEMADYPKLLGVADLGISLHTSTSGADLPMKVVDMFGCGTPVCALEFACIDELVKDGINGRTFKNAEDLANQLIELLINFPSFPSSLDILRAGIKDANYAIPDSGGTKIRVPWTDWKENWDLIMLPILATPAL